MKLKKKEIIEIINESKLSSGEFAKPDHTTCPVGAIVRSLLPPGSTHKDIIAASEKVAPRALSRYPFDLIMEKQYLSALSSHFENIMFEYDDQYQSGVREELITFVKLHFPLEIDVYV